MPDYPETNESLIIRVRNPADRAAWSEFEQIYRPVIFRTARARGLDYPDAMDVCQQVLLSVASAINRYEKTDDSVRFRNWLSRITRNAISKSVTRRRKDQATGGTDAMNYFAVVQDDSPDSDELIELEYQRELYRQAASRVRAEIQEATWLAFEMTVLQERSVQDAATSLGISTGSVYAARSRVVRRLRDAVAVIEKSIEGSEANSKG